MGNVPERKTVTMGERIRIIDIAEELGVSTATVSNVIHGKTNKISDETVKRVQALLEEKQYIPSMAGILLAQNDSRIVGIVINNHEKYEDHVLEDPFIASAVNALSLELERAGYFMMIKATKQWNDIVRFASMWNMEGLVLIGFCEQDYKKLRESMRIPFVVYEGFFQDTERICNLTIDNYDGGRQVGDYLRNMGHRKVLCIADNYICMDKERIEGCRESLKECQMDIMQIPFHREERIEFYRAQLTKIKEYTAIFAASDFYAVELIRFLQDQGIHVPEEISVVGFDNSPWCEMIQPALTTVKQDSAERARFAVTLLQQLKNGTCKRTSITMPVTLVKRASVRNLQVTSGERGLGQR